MRLDNHRHGVDARQEFFFAPDGVQQFPQAADIGRAHRVVAVQAVGDSAIGPDRRGVAGGAVKESVIRPPGNERQGRVRVRLAVQIEVVAVAGIAVPVPDEHLGSPEGEKAIQINGGRQRFQTGRRGILQRGDNRVNV